MEKRKRDTESDGIAAEAVDHHTVFIDTSLDTHIAMLVSCYDTVSDFKKKLVSEHMQCYPNIGEIQIHSLKVKRRGNSYHLPDAVLVWSVLQGGKRNWFLSADASGSPACHLNQNSLEVGRSNGVNMDARNVDGDCRSLSCDVNKMQNLLTYLGYGVTENNVVVEMIDGFKSEESLEKITGSQSNNFSLVNCMGTESRPRKKRKMRQTKDVCHDPHLKDNSKMFPASAKDKSVVEFVSDRNLIVNAVKEGPEALVLYEKQRKPTMSEASAEVSGVRNDQSTTENRVAPERTSALATADKSNSGRTEDTLPESVTPENLMASQLESECGRDVSLEELRGVSAKVPDLPPRFINEVSAIGDASPDGSTRKRKISQKRAVKMQDITDVKQTRKGENSKPSVETLESGENKEEEDLSLNHDHEVIIPSESRGSAFPNVKEASFSPPLSNAMEADFLSGGKNKKKKRGMKTANTSKPESGNKQTGHVPKETEKGESICHKGKDVQMKLLDDSSKDSGKNAQDANTNEGESVILTQTEHALEDAAPKVKEDQSSNCNQDVRMKLLDDYTKDAGEIAQGANTSEENFVIPTQTKQTLGDLIPKEKKHQGSASNHDDVVIGKENQVEKFNQVEHSNNRHKKPKKKVKTVQVNLLNSSTKYDSLIDQGADTTEASFVALNQTLHKLEDAITEKKETEKTNQTSATNCNAAIGKKNHDVEFNQVEMDHEKTDNNNNNKDSEPTKKIKKRRATASGFQENFPVKDQKVGNEALTTEGKSTEANFVVLTQTLHNLKDTITGEKEEKTIETSVTNCNAAIGKENHDVEFNQVEMDHEKSEKNMDRKPTKKIKKRRETASGFQEQVPIKDQKVGNEALTRGKPGDANTIEANFVVSTQTLHNLGDAITEEKEMEKTNQSSVSNCNAAIGKENHDVELNQVEMDHKKAENNKCRKPTKKMKKRRETASGFPENVPIKNKEVGKEALTTEGKSSDPAKFQISENEKIKTQEKVKENGVAKELQNSLKLSENDEGNDKSHVGKNSGKRKGDSAWNSDREGVIPDSLKSSLKVSEDGAKCSSENEGEGINFKQYFVPDQYEDKVGSSDKVKKATKPNEKIKTQEKVKENGVAKELQNSLKLSENSEGNNISHVGKKSGKRKGDSVWNSDREGVIPDSLERSLTFSEKEVKVSGTEMLETSHKKPKEIIPASSYRNQKKPSMDRSSSGKSLTVSKNGGNARLQSGLSVTNKMEVKTPKLLSRIGPLFQDSSSSEDENETLPSNVRTQQHPSDSSSESDSGEESDVSQDSPRSGSNGAKGRSTERKNISELKMDMTMDMILKSSKRFKKAKLLLDSQNESEQVELVPESQPI